MKSPRTDLFAGFAGLCLGTVLISSCQRAEGQAAAPAPIPAQAVAAVLPAEKWQQLESAVDRGLAWMAGQQVGDGAFPTYASGQPGVTSLCILAFLSRGY
jgi:hypothetical protein